MKKLLLFLIISTLGFADAQEGKQTIEVTGYYKFLPQIDRYRVYITLQLDGDMYNNPREFKSVTDLKNFYFKRLKEKGFDTNKFSEDELSFVTRSGRYDIQGTYLIYETTSKEEVLKISKETYGRMIYPDFYLAHFKDLDYDKGIQEAIKDGKQKAEKLAKSLSVKLGKLQSSEVNTSLLNSEWSTYDFVYNISIDYRYVTVGMVYVVE